MKNIFDCFKFTYTHKSSDISKLCFFLTVTHFKINIKPICTQCKSKTMVYEGFWRFYSKSTQTDVLKNIAREFDFKPSA